MKMLQPDAHGKPEHNLKVVKLNRDSLDDMYDSTAKMNWLGHSSFFIELDGKNILLDPVFSKSTGPPFLVGRKKFNSEMPIEIEEQLLLGDIHLPVSKGWKK